MNSLPILALCLPALYEIVHLPTVGAIFLARLNLRKHFRLIFSDEPRGQQKEEVFSILTLGAGRFFPPTLPEKGMRTRGRRERGEEIVFAPHLAQISPSDRRVRVRYEKQGSEKHQRHETGRSKTRPGVAARGRKNRQIGIGSGGRLLRERNGQLERRPPLLLLLSE